MGQTHKNAVIMWRQRCWQMKTDLDLAISVARRLSRQKRRLQWMILALIALHVLQLMWG